MNTTSLTPIAPELHAQQPYLPAWARGWRTAGLCCCLALASGLASPGRAAEPAAAEPAAAVANKPAPSASAAKSVGEQLRAAVESTASAQKRLSLVINGTEKKYITLPAKAPSVPAEAPSKSKDAKASESNAAATLPRPAPAPVKRHASRTSLQAKAAAPGAPTAALALNAGHGGAAHWSYDGASGPLAWGQLRPDFQLCAAGQRQSPINIDEASTLQGPAEPLQFRYQPSSGSVVNDGRTIQVDLLGENALWVRGSSYKLVEFHFHHPAEERINNRSFAMVVHLVHRNDEGQLAILAVLLEPGAANALIDKVWTYMPLDIGDRVRMPAGLIDLNDLLPKDQRYYQFMGSLSTPPCTEGVLWLVLKQPTSVSAAQLRLFSQLFPHNIRPLQPLNGRAVRDAQ